MAADRQAYIHTHNFRNAVTLVWGSLRLAPMRQVCIHGELLLKEIQYTYYFKSI